MLLTLQAAQFYLLVALSAMTIYACSWLLSIHIYRKKCFKDIPGALGNGMPQEALQKS